jgi:hypothetical protein
MDEMGSIRPLGVMRWWWLSRPRAIGPAWSREERQTVCRIHLIAIPLLAACCYNLVMFLFERGVDAAVVAFGSVAASAVIAFTTARVIALWLWPELLRRADENAARRYADNPVQ